MTYTESFILTSVITNRRSALSHAAQNVWTDGQDMQIRRRRIEGASWETIAAELSLAMMAVTERGCRSASAGRRPSGAPSADLLREPLPSGHPASWDAITSGTVLEGRPYPLPYFRR